jgi:Flp pilus assembly protein TadG
MLDIGTADRPQRGQILILFAFALTAIVLVVGLVVDGGYALSQRRASQNAADFAALAGARVIAEEVGGNTVDGTDTNVKTAISSTIATNGGAPITFGAPNGPVYVNTNGVTTGYVGVAANGRDIPAGTVGVRVASSRTWRPFFLGLAGINNWSAGATATAKGGYAAGGPTGTVFPAGIAEAVFNGRSPCVGDPTNNVGGSGPCDPVHLTPGKLNVPGGFGWLKFGAVGKCLNYGLGMSTTSGCDSNAGFLQTEIDGNSYGCCSAVSHGLAPADRIGNLPGNKVSADCSNLITDGTIVTIAVWDNAGGTGDGAWYHIIGFTGWQITGCSGGKDLEGVFKQQFYLGPTTTTPGFAGAPLAVQLVH